MIRDCKGFINLLYFPMAATRFIKKGVSMWNACLCKVILGPAGHTQRVRLAGKKGSRTQITESLYSTCTTYTSNWKALLAVEKLLRITTTTAFPI